jgi:hypothetical protein
VRTRVSLLAGFKASPNDAKALGIDDVGVGSGDAADAETAGEGSE